jgi:hypothetical protein
LNIICNIRSIKIAFPVPYTELRLYIDFTASLVVCYTWYFLNNFAACHSRIFDCVRSVSFYFLRNRYYWHNFCCLWFTEHRLQISLCCLSKLITSIILVTVASSRNCEIKSWN